MTTLPLGLLQQAVGAPGGPSIGLKPRGPLSPSDVHVLVVDDEPISRHVVSSLLKCCHYKVTTADNGAEAMDLLRSSPPDTFQLVLTDVCMPEVDGIQLLQYVKQEENLRSVPVIMMSSIEQGSTVHDCVTYGAEEYLVKPVTRKEVVNMWQHVLRKQTASAMAVPQQQHAIAREIVTKDGGARSNQANQANQMNQANQNEIKMTKSIKPMRTDSADWKSAGHVLRLIHNAKHAEAARVAGQLAKVEADIGVMLQWKRSWQDQPSSGKRRRTTLSPTLEPHFRSIDDTYYSRRQRAEGCSHNDGDVPNMLVSLSKDLDILDRDPRFVKRATVRAEDTASPQEMVCCTDFDADDAHVATVGVSKVVKVFEVASFLNSKTSAVHIPIWQASARSKLSSVAWNSYIRPYLVTADYDGSIQLWDTNWANGQSSSEVSHFEEHSKRVWSVDFSRIDPPKFLSGSDDGTVKLWSINQEVSAMTMRTPANVCSVQFSNHSNHLVAAGCANHRVYLFDLRRPDVPAAQITGPRKAVSYVRFLGNDILCAASTDSTIRLWNIESMLEQEESSTHHRMASPSLVNTMTGHVNERNFVGLSVSQDGYILTGSEDNCVYAYYKTLNFPITKYVNGEVNAPAIAGKKGFVSSVSWARSCPRALVADSRGGVCVLDFVFGKV